MAANTIVTEDDVRDQTRDAMGLFPDADTVAGTAQLTSFNRIAQNSTDIDLSAFLGIADKPDGWWFPRDRNDVAIVMEAKNSRENLSNWRGEIEKNMRIAARRYDKVVGVLTNGKDVEGYKITGTGTDFRIERIDDLSEKIEPVSYYAAKYNLDPVDKEHIYAVTARINNMLHSDFGVNDLYDRMVFTACALVAQRYGAKLGDFKGHAWAIVRSIIITTLSGAFEDSENQNDKIDELLNLYSGIQTYRITNQALVDGFIDAVVDIAGSINSNQWRGEDVMGIFFNEFNRYKGKAERGQVFTPEHICDFMCKLIDVRPSDKVLDAACGSGGFLVKAMSIMIQAAGGPDTAEASRIKSERLFGIELDPRIHALACANMLIHKDGHSNIEELNTKDSPACDWIRSKGITKVLMNPPFETKFGCMDIVSNVLNNVEGEHLAAFILPSNKLEKTKRTARNLMRTHTLEMIIKLPEDVFLGLGLPTSIFVWRTNVPQRDTKIFSCWMQEDGLVTVKNKGRHDVNGEWPAIENHWLEFIRTRGVTDPSKVQLLDPAKHLSYQVPEEPFALTYEDLRRSAMDYIMFRRGIDAQKLKEKVAEQALYSSSIHSDDDGHVDLRLNIRED